LDTITFMKWLKFLLFVTIFWSLQGCVYFNEEGIGTRKYRDCVEYYDAEGIYHKECDPNISEYPITIEH
jgi:hypothetical protein